MGQFIEFLDEKHRFCSLYYCLDSQDSSLATAYKFSVKRQEQLHSRIPYENITKSRDFVCYKTEGFDNLRLLALAQDMAHDFGLELYVRGTLTDTCNDKSYTQLDGLFQ